MAPKRQKAVFTADVAQVRQIRMVVQSGRYRSSSALLREAIDEKLERLRRERLAEQVDHYCDQGLGDEDLGLVESQAFDSKK